MDGQLLNKWASKERELKTRLETLHSSRQKGFNLHALELNTRLLMQEVISLRGRIEQEVTDEDMEQIEISIKEGGNNETF